MSVTTVNTDKFNAICRQISNLSGASYEQVVKAEVGKVLEAAIKFTPALKIGKIRARFANAEYSQQPPGLYSPKTARSGDIKLSKNGSIKYFLGNRYPNALWRAIQKRRKDRLASIIGARGLAQQSWLKIAVALGIKIDHPAYVDKAIASTGKNYIDTSAKKFANAEVCRILVENAQPTVNAIGGGRALQRALAGRVKFFEQNVAHAVFSDISKIARAYPGLAVKVPPAADT